VDDVQEFTAYARSTSSRGQPERPADELME
jgi:hypothetical protein